MNTNNARSLEHTLKQLNEAFAANAEIQRELARLRARLSDAYEREAQPLRAQLVMGSEVIKECRTQYERQLVAQWGGLISPDDEIRCATFLPGFSPDLSMLFNPPYPGFCEGMLTEFMRHHYLFRVQTSEDKDFNIGLRYSPEKDNLPLMLKGITALLPYVTKTETGHIPVSANTSITFSDREGGSAYIAYESLVIDPESGETNLLIHKSRREETVRLHFRDVRSALLHLVSARYSSINRYRKLFE
ncbi:MULTISPECIES: hypothetical protein [Enterobacteriaceae]|uniref:hypothetical protein n=1 Tax=Enterobacteriaceae TaxID=543 RepID=UPI000E1DD894|nr:MULTISPECIES: hypothetical protein [Enterobacteriaceae]ELK0756182.1 hypothetical protein [Klebsiella oxytoca]RDT14127.1 hypothetical protein DXF84_10695 [Escherichia coli]RDT38360.1 hypothetical protein DXF86_17195 [Citrobacter freundii]RXK65123.1 hypothetical protein ET141_27295 [Klebsiella pneumoniae]